MSYLCTSKQRQSLSPTSPHFTPPKVRYRKPAEAEPESRTTSATGGYTNRFLPVQLLWLLSLLARTPTSVRGGGLANQIAVSLTQSY